MTFAEEIRLGIPDCLPEPMPYDNNINHPNDLAIEFFGAKITFGQL